MTSATINDHAYFLDKPRSTFNVFWPYVLISLLFAAYSFRDGDGLHRSFEVGGMTDISAPVSIKKRRCDVLSVIWIRQTCGENDSESVLLFVVCGANDGE